MAIYKGREVSLMHDVPKGHVDPVDMTIRQKDGSTENVRLSELQLTKEEKTAMEKSASQKFDYIRVIEDKDLQDIRDSQDEEKIKERLAKQDTPQDVTIQARGATLNQSSPQPTVPVVHNARPAVKK